MTHLLIILLVWPAVLWSTSWDPTPPGASIGWACSRGGSLISCRFEPLDGREGWARATGVQVVAGRSVPASLDMFVGDHLQEAAGESTWYALVGEMPQTMEKSFYLLPAEGVPISTLVVVNHPVMGPFLLMKTKRMTEIMASIIAEPESPNLNRAMLWGGFKGAPSQNRGFYEVEFAWRTPSFDETSDIIDDEDLSIVKQVVELDVYLPIFRHYLMCFAFVKHQRFDPEWLMEIVRRDLANGKLWPVQEDVIIKYGTAQDIDKVKTVCVADTPYGAILAGAAILAARRPDEARQFIQQQLDNRTVRTEFREAMEKRLQGIGTDAKTEAE